MPHSRLVIDSLKKFSNGLTKQECIKKNIKIELLIKNHLLIKKESKNIELIIPEKTVRWANKFKFTRKKYGIEEKTTFIDKYYLTSKGKKLKLTI